MKMKRKTAILTTLICLSPILLGVALYDRLPEMVPTHFGLDGTPNGWSSRPMAVFGLPLLMAGLNLLCIWGTQKAMKDQQRKVAPDALVNLCYWIPAVLSVIVVPMCLFSAIGVELPMTFILELLLGVTFLIIGNYLPKCKMNAVIGIKLPWTYSSDENWRRTHRLGGFVWVAAGLLMLLNMVLRSELLPVLVMVGAILIPGVYSYLLYRKDQQKK